MPEFLKTPTGQAVFGVAVALIALIIIELNYRFFFKYLLDFVFGLVFSLLCAPVLIAGAVISYKRAGHVFEKTPYLSRREIARFVSTGPPPSPAGATGAPD